MNNGDVKVEECCESTRTILGPVPFLKNVGGEMEKQIQSISRSVWPRGCCGTISNCLLQLCLGLTVTEYITNMSAV